MDKKARDNRANQMNPNNPAYYMNIFNLISPILKENRRWDSAASFMELFVPAVIPGIDT